MKKLSAKQVVELHDELLDLYGGLPGIASMDTIKSAVEQPFQSVFGEDAYPSVAAKAAMLDS